MTASLECGVEVPGKGATTAAVSIDANDQTTEKTIMSELRFTDRRTVLKTIGAGVVGSATIAGIASAEHGERGTFGTWGSDGTDEWELLDTGHHPSDPEAHQPLYLILPSGGCQSPHFGPVDHVVDTPGGRQGDYYSAEWHVQVPVDTTKPAPPNSGLDGAPIDCTGLPPTISNIDALVDADDDLKIQDMGFHFTCPVRRYQGNGC